MLTQIAGVLAVISQYATENFAITLGPQRAG